MFQSIFYMLVLQIFHALRLSEKSQTDIWDHCTLGPYILKVPAPFLIFISIFIQAPRKSVPRQALTFFLDSNTIKLLSEISISQAMWLYQYLEMIFAVNNYEKYHLSFQRDSFCALPKIIFLPRLSHSNLLTRYMLYCWSIVLQQLHFRMLHIICFAIKGLKEIEKY